MCVSFRRRGSPGRAGRRARPQGTLVYGPGAEDNHDPRAEFRDDYIEIYRNLDQLPGVLEGKQQIKEKLEQVIRDMGGSREP